MPLMQIDWVVIFTFTVAWYFQPFQRVDIFNRYDETVGWIPGAPPRWLFGPAWAVIYALLSAATFIFWRDGVAADQYTSTMTLILINWVLNKIWFITYSLSNLASFFIIVATLGTAISVVVSFAVVGIWSSFVMWLIYVLWLVYASYLNGAQVFMKRTMIPAM